MAQEEVMALESSPAPSDHKRKHEDLEQQQHPPEEVPEDAPADEPQPAKSIAEADADKQNDDGVNGDLPEAKRPRVEETDHDGLASENGFEGDKSDLHAGKMEEGDVEKPNVVENNDGNVQPASEGVPETTDKETDNDLNSDMQEASVEDSKTGSAEEKAPAQGETEKLPSEEDEQLPVGDGQTTSRKMEVPNDKVGVLIGKGGDTIRYLQYNSGAKIQITRDAEADPHSTTRPVELIGTLSNINKAEKLINAVIAEADAGGSPSLIARGLTSSQNSGVTDQLEIQVPNEKVGLIIGRGGDTIKSLQAKSGARIQLIPQHLPEGDGSKERTVRVTGDKKQIEVARDMIKDVMNQTVRPSPLSSGFSQQQSYRPRGSTGPAHWGPKGPYSSHSMSNDYQRGPYPSQNSQYPPPNYGGYPSQQMAPRSNFGSGWEQRPSASMQGPHPHSGGYDYYGGQGGHVSDHPASVPISSSIPGHAPGPSPAAAMGPPQANYNYGQPHGADYGHQAPYSQAVPPQQSYGQGYDEPKYENHAQHHPYGHGSSHPVYPQAGNQPGYGAQHQYGKQPSYGMQSQGPPPQSYGPPRPSQPGDLPYQGPVQTSQSYGPNVPPQQQYPYASSGPMQQAYPPYGSGSTTDVYNQAPPASGPGYTQQGGQAIQSYAQPGGQQAAGYGQGPAGGYGSYPSSQQAYPEQSAANNAGYGYQAPQDPTYGSGPGSAYGAPNSQQGYAQPTPTQPSYDQSVQQSGGYGATQTSAPLAYGKTVSPQPGYPQYDSTQMYVAPAPR